MGLNEQPLSREEKDRLCCLEVSGLVAAACPGSFDEISDRLLMILSIMGHMASDEQRTSLAFCMAKLACRLDGDLRMARQEQ